LRRVSIADRDARLVSRGGAGGKEAERQGSKEWIERTGTENGKMKRENAVQEVPEMLRLI
jgi:hypothetical protein